MIDNELIDVLDNSSELLTGLSDAGVRLCKMLDDDGNQFGWVMIKDSTSMYNTLPWYGYIKKGNSRNYPEGYFYRTYFSGPETSILQFNADGDIIFPDSYYGQSTEFKPYMVIKRDDLTYMYLNTAECHSCKFTLTKSGATQDEVFYYTFILPRKNGNIKSLKSATDLGQWGDATYYLDSAGTKLRIYRAYQGGYQAEWTASDGTERTIKAFHDDSYDVLDGGAGQ